MVWVLGWCRDNAALFYRFQGLNLLVDDNILKGRGGLFYQSKILSQKILKYF